MSEPILPDDREVGDPERLHPLFLVTGLGGALRGLAGGYAAIGYLAVTGKLGVALAGAIALLLFMAGGIFLYWRRFEFRVGHNEIRIDSGILSRRHRSIPFDRVQDVDLTQGPVARLLGLAKLKFETGGATAGPNAEEAVLHAIPLARAHDIRERVRSRRGAVDADREAVGDVGELAPPLFAMDTRRLLLAGTFNFSLAVFAGLIGLTQTFGDVAGFDPLNRRFWTGVAEGSDPVVQLVFQHRAGAAIAGIVLLLVVGATTGIVRTVMRDYGFRLDRTGVGLRRRRGLLTLSDVTLPARRLQAAMVISGPLRRLFGWVELKVQSLAQDEGSADHVLAPLARAGEVAVILEALHWRAVPPAIRWQRVSRAYIWTFMIALSPLFLLFGIQSVILSVTPIVIDPAIRSAVLGQFAPLLILIAVILLALAIAVVGRRLSWGRTGYALDGDRLLIRKGWWRSRILILPLDRIQSIDVVESLASRWFGVASLVFGVAGGGVGGHRLPAIRRETARELRRELLV
jgi:putative membrane protein